MDVMNHYFGNSMNLGGFDTYQAPIDNYSNLDCRRCGHRTKVLQGAMAQCKNCGEYPSRNDDSGYAHTTGSYQCPLCSMYSYLHAGESTYCRNHPNALINMYYQHQMTYTSGGYNSPLPKPKKDIKKLIAHYYNQKRK